MKLEELLPLKVYPFTLSYKIGSSLKNGGKYDAVCIHFNLSINVHVVRNSKQALSSNEGQQNIFYDLLYNDQKILLNYYQNPVAIRYVITAVVYASV